MSSVETNPAAAFAASLNATMSRLGLDDHQGAAYLGVPVTTYRKWIKGERAPSASVVRLLYVLGMLEALAPALHASLVPSSALSA